MTRPGTGSIVVLLAILGGLAGLVAFREQGPAPLPASAPASQFSAVRARDELQRILGEGLPHPLGTPADAEVRARLAERFRALGYEVEERPGFGCSAYALCGPVRNLFARRPGEARVAAVALSAHYDSVPSGPGASDDGMGVGVLLEVARALRDERAAHPLLFVVTDGEEGGLLGAEAIAADPAQRAELGVVLNVENRGTAGSSNLFETSHPNRWLVETVGPALSRPHASSLFASIYDLLPNDTDLSVYKRAGLAGLNFAAIGEPWHYHTPLDSLENADLRTFQHHGDQVLASARALLQADDARRPDGDAIYFDVLSAVLVRWPDAATPALAALVGLLCLFAAVVAARAEGARAVLFGLLGFFLGLVLAGLLGVAVVRTIGSLRPDRVLWQASPLLLIGAEWLAGLAGALLGARLLRRGSPAASLAGAALGWALLGAGLIAGLHGGLRGTCYLALVPAAGFALGALLCRAGASWSGTTGTLLALVVVALLFLPLAELLYGALGTPVAPAIALVFALIASALAPLAARVRGADGLIAVVALATGIAAVAASREPQWTPERPLGLNLEYAQTSREEASWTASDMVGPLQDAGRFACDSSAAPWFSPLFRPPRWRGAAPALRLEPVELQVLADEDRDGKRVLRLRLATRRGARLVRLFFHSSIAPERIAVDGLPVPAQRKPVELYAPGWRGIVAYEREASLELSFPRREPIELVAEDVSPGLPPQGAALAELRNRAGAVPIHEGDLTLTRVRRGPF